MGAPPVTKDKGVLSMATKLYVGGFPFDTTEDQLRELFEQAGTVVSASIVMDQYSGRSKGFGFVEMSTGEEATKAVTDLNGSMMGQRTIRVEESKPSTGPRRTGGGGGRGGGGGGGRFGGGGGSKRW
jgi:cold-inducible RNA-binding protein